MDSWTWCVYGWREVKSIPPKAIDTETQLYMDAVQPYQGEEEIALIDILFRHRCSKRGLGKHQGSSRSRRCCRPFQHTLWKGNIQAFYTQDDELVLDGLHRQDSSSYCCRQWRRQDSHRRRSQTWARQRREDPVAYRAYPGPCPNMQYPPDCIREEIHASSGLRRPDGASCANRVSQEGSTRGSRRDSEIQRCRLCEQRRQSWANGALLRGMQ